MSFSSRRRNYLLTPHRRDGLIEWMKSMLNHSFVLDALDTTAADTFSHFEVLIEEHRTMTKDPNNHHSSSPSRLKVLVPTVGVFHTPLPLRRAFEAYNAKHCLTKRKHITISFNELRHICNLAQIMAMRRGDISTTTTTSSTKHAHDSETEGAAGKSENGGECTGGNGVVMDPFRGPSMITFDGDQTLYSDGANFESNPTLANYLYLLLKHGVVVAIVTAAGYEYRVEKYEYRISGLLAYFQQRGLTEDECERFYLLGGECNYLLSLGPDYRLHPVRETGPGGWMISTRYLQEAPGNWNEDDVTQLLDVAEQSLRTSLDDQKLRATLIRKKRSIGLVPVRPDAPIPREALDESVLRVHSELQQMSNGEGPNLPYCAFNGGRDVWVDVGNKRVGVQILQSYLGIPPAESIHVGDQFLNTGNDYLARDVCPCIWITSPDETTYILKSILRLAGVSIDLPDRHESAPDDVTLSPPPPEEGSKHFVEDDDDDDDDDDNRNGGRGSRRTNPRPMMDFGEVQRRTEAIKMMNVYTGEMKPVEGQN